MEDAVTMYATMTILVFILTLVFCAQTIGRNSAICEPMQPEGKRLVGMDGLRGILALSVIFYHAHVSMVHAGSGEWATSSVVFFRLMGNGAVGMFFMITAYLFWGKMRKSVRWAPLYLSRFARIIPLYVLSVTLAFALSFLLAVKLDAPSDLFVKYIQWLSFEFIELPDINGILQSFTLVAGVYWTLKYEWIFYIGLPFLYLFRGPKGRFVLLLLFLITVAVQIYEAVPTKSFTLGHVSNFFGLGMLAYELSSNKISNRVLSVIAVFSIALYFFAFDTAYSIAAASVLGLAFWCVVSGGTVFGLLTSVGARSAGAISYSIYLLHGLALAAAWSILPAVQIGDVHYWALLAGVMALLMLVCGLTYRWVELPFISLGQRKLPVRAQVISPQ